MMNVDYEILLLKSLSLINSLVHLLTVEGHYSRSHNISTLTSEFSSYRHRLQFVILTVSVINM